MQIRKWMAVILAVVIGAMSTLSAAADTVPTYIYDVESGETWEELTSVVPNHDDLTVPTDASALEIGGKSAVLMELSTGKLLFAHHEHDQLPIASVTKIMTLLLVMEAIDDGVLALTDPVVCSKTAASMGGSQIWLEEGETMTVHELLKAAVIVSANDACAALAETISGSIEGFVSRMNERAAELGMNDTRFVDCSGLNDEGISSAYDVAVMSRELMTHPKIKEYTTIWMDTLRDGKSQLVNTNKLIRFYQGATGLKTGTTSAAGHCLSATAERGNIGFVAVVLGCKTTDERFGGARKLLDYGFANYALYEPSVTLSKNSIPVIHGVERTVPLEVAGLEPILLKKGQEKSVQYTVRLDDDVMAPVEKGQLLGKVTFTIGDKEIATASIVAKKEIGRLKLGDAWEKLLYTLLS